MAKIFEGLLKISLILIGMGGGSFVGVIVIDQLLPPPAHFLWRGQEVYPDVHGISDILHVKHSERIEYATIIARLTDDSIVLLHQNQQQRLAPLPNSPSYNFYFDYHPDRIYLETSNGDLYELVNSDWVPIFLDEKPYLPQTYMCEDRIIYPFVKEQIIDSNGFIFEHALANTYFCYTISQNGNLTLYTKSLAFFHIYMVPPPFIIGLIIGFFLSLRIIKIFERRWFL